MYLKEILYVWIWINNDFNESFHQEIPTSFIINFMISIYQLN